MALSVIHFVWDRVPVNQAPWRCETAHDFRALFWRWDFQRCLYRLERSMSNLRNQTQEEFAIRWARNITSPSNHNLNEDRRVAKSFVTRLCNCRYINNSRTLTRDDEWVELLKIDHGRLKRIMKILLLLDRANAWYNLVNSEGGKGKHWYAEFHLGHASVTREMRQTNQSGDDEYPINKRFMMLLNDPLLADIMDVDIRSLLQPAPSPKLGNPHPANCQFQCFRGLRCLWNTFDLKAVLLGLLFIPAFLIIEYLWKLAMKIN